MTQNSELLKLTNKKNTKQQSTNHPKHPTNHTVTSQNTLATI